MSPNLLAFQAKTHIYCCLQPSKGQDTFVQVFKKQKFSLENRVSQPEE